ncbi:MAG: response regulator transcription factor [Actinobacteria bacterium]|nr:response regulator transcription factor [Actinomycetota bacterium]MBV8599466.1 response regulator transcription factor [Actinomycetota bacterium]
MSTTTVLLAEREPAMRTVLEHKLRHDGFELVSAPESARPDLVLADDESALDRWRGEAPVILLGHAQSDHVDRVRAFRRGCDDYVARPFHYEELLERIRAVLRRSGAGADRIEAGPIGIDLATRVVRVAGTPMPVSQKEYALLVRLASEPQRVFTKEQLLREIWGYQLQGRTRTLDSHASRLRRKLRELDPDTLYVENVWGVGYRLLGLHD